MSEKIEIVNELHRSARKNFERVPFQMRGIDDTFQIDLIEFIPFAIENNGFRYALVVIDVFSKFAWTIALKRKTGLETSKAMESVLRKSGRICRNCQSDNGKEFYNKHFSSLMKRYTINHYSTFSKLKASICERLNRTLLQKLWKIFHINGNHKWVNALDTITAEYNTSVHRTIRMRPIDVNSQNEKQLLETVYMRNNSVNVSSKSKFHIGDKVRISKHKQMFEKGYTPSWTTEIFQVDKILSTEPITYVLRDLLGELIRGSFYSYELQKSDHDSVYLVEKIIKSKGDKVFVKWLGFDHMHNSWVSKNDLL